MKLHTMSLFAFPVEEWVFKLKNKFHHKKSKQIQVLGSNDLHWPVKLKINFITGNPNKCKY